MKFSPEAAQQLYPHLGTVECEKHGEAPKAKVPHKLLGVFANRPNPQWVCAGCITEARGQWDAQAKELKQQKREAKEAQRGAIKRARESAKNADQGLAEYVSECQNAVGAVKTAEREIESTQAKITTAKHKVAGALQRLEKAKSDYEAHQDAFIQLVDLKDSQFETLDNADSAVAVCYNVLQDKLNEADALWDVLGKAAKKKRDKGNRKTAVALIRERIESVDEVEQQSSEDERDVEEPRDVGEQEESE
jgi:chromosome segregation ATPase